MKTPNRCIPLLVLVGLLVTQSGEAQITQRLPPGVPDSGTVSGMTLEAPINDATPPANISSTPGVVAISLTWPAVPGASNYSVSRNPSAEGRFVPVTATPITSTEFTDNGLTPATNYYYIVTAARPDGHYGTSAPVHVRTLAGINPTGLKGSAKGNDITLTWDAVPNVASYSVLVPGRPHTTVAGTSYTANALPDGAHAFAVWSLHRSGNQDYAADELNPARVTVNAGVLRGRYRVTLTGFYVHNETTDNAAQWDGKRDEVFISTDVKFLDLNGNQVIQGFSPSVPSYVFGDTYKQNPNQRKQAGSASDRGGIRTGDRYPLDDPYSGVPIQGPQWIPLKLWEGDLVQGQNAVVVTPTIWEFDGSQNAAVFNGWVQWAQGTTQKLRNSKEFGEMVGAEGATALALTGLSLDLALSFSNQVLGQDGDRPIGVNRSGPTVSFQPQTLALNYENIESFLSQGHEAAGLPRGLYPVQYIDTGEWGGGNYIIYLKVEKVMK